MRGRTYSICSTLVVSTVASISTCNAAYPGATQLEPIRWRFKEITTMRVIAFVASSVVVHVDQPQYPLLVHMYQFLSDFLTG